MKLKKRKNILIFWLSAGTCCEKPGDYKNFFLSKSGELEHSFSQESFACLEIIFQVSKIMRQK